MKGTPRINYSCPQCGKVTTWRSATVKEVNSKANPEFIKFIGGERCSCDWTDEQLYMWKDIVGNFLGINE